MTNLYPSPPAARPAPPRAARWRFAALAAVGVLSAGALAGCGIDNEWRHDKVENVYEIAEEVTGLDVRADSGRITITTGTGPVRVKEILRFRGQRPEATHIVEGNTLKLQNGSCAGRRNCSVAYDIRVPASLAVSAHSDSGAIDVSGLAGDVNLSADSGRIEASDLASPVAKARTDSGSVELRFSAAPTEVEADVDSGRISIQVPSGTGYAVTATTDSGRRDISVDIDESSSHRIRATADSGSIEVSNR